MPEEVWRDRQRAHEARVDAWIAPHLQRRSHGISHPVEDFLFTYYSYRPSALRRWHPGLGVTLAGAATEFGSTRGYVVDGDLAWLDPTVVADRARAADSIRALLISTQTRPPLLACFGLHEWAMVYRQRGDELRHADFPLRLGAAGTDEVVETHRISCTHYDAFRFFTDAARPRNAVQPTRETQSNIDQPGCLHATMDLYKWAYKLSPTTSSELVADCFELARDVRVIDMRAAPYDLTKLGYLPIRIETVGGKAEYIDAQRGFAERARPLRQALIDVCDQVLASEDVASA